ncbi:MAG: cupin domain-containing protein [Halobacteriaceae archaeon]
MPALTALEDPDGTPHADVFERPRTVRLALDADQRLPSHEHPDTNIVLYLVSGRLELTLGSDTYTLGAGDLIRFGGNQEISPRAVEPSTALLVFAPSG